jgi:hypothetical protein
VSIDVFLSIGTPTTPQQEALIGAFENCLRQHGLNPRALGRTDWSDEQPLRHIRRVMSQCDGTAVLALERVFIATGAEKRGSADESHLTHVSVPSVWVQIESGMAYEQDQPIFVAVADGLREEGLLEDGHDWVVQRIPSTPEAFTAPAFQDALLRWKEQVVRRAAARRGDGAPPSA